MMKTKFDTIIQESFKSLNKSHRIMYPRGFKLNEDLENAFQKQVIELRGQGMSDKAILNKIRKSLEFHLPQ